MALGLVSSEVLDDYWSRNTRRRVAYDFPQGQAPLTALLSLFEPEFTPIQEFGWLEERWHTEKTITADVTAVFTQTGSTTSAGSPIAVADATAGDSLRVYVVDSTLFQVNDSVGVFNLDLTGGTTYNMLGRVTAQATGYIEIELTNTAPATILNTTNGNEGKYVYLVGSAFAEGSNAAALGRNRFPVEIKNFTQIHKNAFVLTRNALKQPLIYNKSGHYMKALKDNGIIHLMGLELSLMWGDRRSTTAIDADTGETVKRYFSGGLLWFLKQWELGNVSNGGAFDYRPGGADVTAQTDWETYTDKRIIKLAGATMSRSQFNELNSRVFEKTNASSWDKLCLCGQGYLNKVSEMFEKQVTWTSMRENGFKGFDFKLLEHSSNSGTVYYKTHPLFNDPLWRNSAFYIDMGFLMWRPITDSDTDIQEGIQLPGADKRKDQYLTDGGPEIWFPEAHMFVDNLGGITS